MPDDADSEHYDEWLEDASEKRNAQATNLAGLTGKIYVEQPNLLQAHRALLENFFISSNDEAYFWIKTQYQALKQWHRLHTGWHVEWRNDLFSLMRQPSVLTLGHKDSRCILQYPRDFVYVLWILWYAANDQIVKRGNGQLFMLWQMLDRLSEEWKLARSIDILTLGEKADFLDQPLIVANRKSMARALKYLQVLKCLKELDGQIDTWIEQDSHVLYQFTNSIHLLILSLDPEALNVMIAQQKESTIFTPTVFATCKEKQNALTRAWRTLLIGPFLLRFDDSEAFLALAGHVDEIREELELSFGWFLEVNHDYACIIRDATSSPSISLLNLKSTSDQIVLLLCAELRSQVAAGTLKPDYYGCILTTVPYILDLFTAMCERFEESWGKGIRGRDNKILLGDTLKKMRMIGFIRGPDSKNTVLILPTAARYSPRYLEHAADFPLGSNKRKKQKEPVDFQQTYLWTEETDEN